MSGAKTLSSYRIAGTANVTSSSPTASVVVPTGTERASSIATVRGVVPKQRMSLVLSLFFGKQGRTLAVRSCESFRRSEDSFPEIYQLLSVAKDYGHPGHEPVGLMPSLLGCSATRSTLESPVPAGQLRGGVRLGWESDLGVGRARRELRGAILRRVTKSQCELRAKP